MDTPIVTRGGIHADARGMLRFCNDFDMSRIKRFYTVANSTEQPVRGWIGHKKETKWFFPLRGETVVEIEPMVSACADMRKKFILRAEDPVVLRVEPCNWFCIEQNGNSEVLVFSSSKVGEFANDDFRRRL